jgi:broad specificity phosphatase PhoE
MVVIAYVRHGKRNSTPETIFRDGSPGTIPCFLTEEGVEQAHKAGKELARLHVIHLVASPLDRTLQTASIINYEYFVKTGTHLEIEFPEPLLIERQAGKLNNGPVPGGIPWLEFRNNQARTGYPDVEDFNSIKNRIERFVNKVQIKKRENGLIVASTHQDTVHAAAAQALGYDELNPMFTPGVPEGSITIISYRTGNEAKVIGDTEVMTYGSTHLSTDEVKNVETLLRN